MKVSKKMQMAISDVIFNIVRCCDAIAWPIDFRPEKSCKKNRSSFIYLPAADRMNTQKKSRNIKNHIAEN